MPNRILKESILTSNSFNAVSILAQNTFIRLMARVDDYGRYHGGHKTLLGSLFGEMIDSISLEDIGGAIAELAAVNMVCTYKCEDREYIHIVNWFKFNKPRSQESKFPAPPQADACLQMQADVNNCLQMNADTLVYGIRNTDTYTNTNTEIVVVEKTTESGGGNNDNDIKNTMANCGWSRFTRKDRERISALLAIYSQQWIIAAIERAHERGRKDWGYVCGILSDWKIKGMDNSSAKKPIDLSRKSTAHNYIQREYKDDDYKGISPDIARYLEKEAAI